VNVPGTVNLYPPQIGTFAFGGVRDSANHEVPLLFLSVSTDEDHAAVRPFLNEVKWPVRRILKRRAFANARYPIDSDYHRYGCARKSLQSADRV